MSFISKPPLALLVISHLCIPLCLSHSSREFIISSTLNRRRGMCCGFWGNIKTLGLFVCVFWSFNVMVSGNYEMASSFHYFCPFSKWHRQRAVCEKRQRAYHIGVNKLFQICIWGVQKLDECIYFGIGQTKRASLVCCLQCLSVSHPAAIEGPSPVTCSKSLS